MVHVGFPILNEVFDHVRNTKGGSDRRTRVLEIEEEFEGVKVHRVRTPPRDPPTLHYTPSVCESFNS
jgi:hypothetical protein